MISSYEFTVRRDQTLKPVTIAARDWQNAVCKNNDVKNRNQRELKTHAGNEYYDGKSDKVSSYPFLKSIFAEYIDAIREEELYKERDYKDGHKLLESSSKKNRITYAT